MNILQFIFGFLIVSGIGFSLSGCPVNLNVDIMNDSADPIHVISRNSDVVLLAVAPGKKGQIRYNSECLKIRTGGVVYEYDVSLSSLMYADQKILSSSLNSIFTNSHHLKFFAIDGGFDIRYRLPNGCE